MEDQACVARFELHFHCFNCQVNVSAFLDVPDVEGAPRDAEELGESAFLQRQRFLCHRCEGAIGLLVGITEVT